MYPNVVWTLYVCLCDVCLDILWGFSVLKLFVSILFVCCLLSVVCC